MAQEAMAQARACCKAGTGHGSTEPRLTDDDCGTLQWLVAAAPAGAVVTARQVGGRSRRDSGSRLWWLRRVKGRRNKVNSDGPSPSPFIKPFGGRRVTISLV